MARAGEQLLQGLNFDALDLTLPTTARGTALTWGPHAQVDEKKPAQVIVNKCDVLALRHIRLPSLDALQSQFALLACACCTCFARRARTSARQLRCTMTTVHSLLPRLSSQPHISTWCKLLRDCLITWGSGVHLRPSVSLTRTGIGLRTAALGAA